MVIHRRFQHRRTQLLMRMPNGKRQQKHGRRKLLRKFAFYLDYFDALLMEIHSFSVRTTILRVSTNIRKHRNIKVERVHVRYAAHRAQTLRRIQ